MIYADQMRMLTARTSRGRRGFSLIEIVIALAVMSVAIAIFIKLFGGSLDLARQGRNHTIAISIAESQLDALVQQPNHYRWESVRETAEKPFPIRTSEDDPKAGNPVSPPEALPAEVGLDARVRDRYENFRWKAFGRVPSGQSYAEVTVVVLWDEAGRDRKLALTSAVPLNSVTAWVNPAAPEPEPADAAPEDEAPQDAAPAGEAAA